MKYWEMFLFQYLMGGFLFAIGMILAFSSGDMKLQKKESRRYAIILILGFFGYALFHALWIYMAIHT